MASGQGVILPDNETYSAEPNPNNDGTPTKGFAKVFEVSPGKYTGSDGNDRVSISDLVKDNDQIIKTGAGDDIFNFNGSESRLPQNVDRVNGIVDLGTGGNDGVFLGFQLDDYKYTVRSDGGLKIQYVGDNGDVDGVAVTFRGAEYFTFRNVDDVTGQNFQTYTISHDELVARILAASPNPDQV
ncbi:hypothetical protein [Antarcticirhabdus aurantiaca]|uniref:Uncharacterized protein n=1 Tax=Antarcticirhabdus aurantiaca TaxID=2606717 RepID=A0ACD4NQN2_9HYPH|nr:hypothetical protein [Antarcticirhabdus aurantiaca]WAJ29168.1 hypothetical protein OXU80_02685 [Jeongeuplla avenae]